MTFGKAFLPGLYERLPVSRRLRVLIRKPCLYLHIINQKVVCTSLCYFTSFTCSARRCVLGLMVLNWVGGRVTAFQSEDLLSFGLVVLLSEDKREGQGAEKERRGEGIYYK